VVCYEDVFELSDFRKFLAELNLQLGAVSVLSYMKQILWINVMVRSSLLLLLLFVGARLSAATYYVSTAGSDSNPGSQSQPWATVQKAASTVVAGDTVNITAGTYSETVTVSASGTSSLPITFNGPGQVQKFSVTGNYITLTNLTLGTTGGSVTQMFKDGIPIVDLTGTGDIVTSCKVRGYSQGSGVTLEGSSELLSNCDFTLMAWDCVHFTTAESATGCLIVNNFFHDQDNPDAVGFVWGVNITIRGNTVTNIQNSRYDLVHVDFIQNFANSSSSVASNVVVEQNRVVNSDMQCWMLNAANTGVSQSPNIRNWQIRNNVFSGLLQSGFIDMPYVSVYNNIFYKCGVDNAAAFFIGSGSTTSWAPGDNAIIRNNVFLGCDPVGNIQPTWGWFVVQTGTNTVDDHNYFGGIGYAAKSVSETGMVNGGDPRFVNESALDFHLQTNSPLKDMGVTIASFNNDKDGISRPQGAAWDIGPYEISSASPNTNPVISLSPTSLTFGSILTNTTSDLTFTVQNTGGGTLAETATVSAPFSIVSGGSYSLGANQSQPVTVRFSPKVAGSVTSTVTFTGGGGMVAGVSGTGVNPPPALSTTFQATSGTITAPFVITSGLAGTNYILQSVETTVTNGGQAVYSFMITNAGSYVVQVLVNAPNDAANSLYLNIDAQPQDPTMIWDIPVTTGFEQKLVSWRGNGTPDNDQFVPQTFNLAVGTHQIIVVGREANVQLQNFTISPAPPVPQNLRIISP
jgi:hypothetical protein